MGLRHTNCIAISTLAASARHNSASKVTVVLAGETGSGSSSGGEFLDVSLETRFWIGVGLACDAAVGAGVAIYENEKGHHREILLV